MLKSKTAVIADNLFAILEFVFNFNDFVFLNF